ncbi:Calcineurin-like phosphoesterase [compost metagenome]
MSKKIVVIADTQVKPSHDLTYLKHIGEYIAEKRPDVIVHIGDHFDFESLSSYDRGKLSFEGRRLKADIEAGLKGMDEMLAPIKSLQQKQRFFKKKVYNPRMVFCTGNHEARFDRVAEEMPEMEGFVGTHTLGLDKMGWEVFPFLKPAEIEGIFFSHYLANPFNGKPYGGNAMSQLKTVGRSFVVGHKQCLDIAIRPTIDDKMQIGIINGAAYPHFEAYKGYTGNNHFRGITMLHEVEDGFGTPMFVSLDFLKKKYGE